ncbi:hypothetical protein M409DRAFT_20364 [Zasmidium cellare ATCC 36951]|uniref:C2H2-type domain-containing protein n=1 Tax=Zasmidium cellare ATCC 36951 TaxID=1080233 RepID=A0A6A6CPD1_ZASCE|nr:uncharacterized protein M409DRAFT_20364 [Zasmidium cellare ATCC 36951]KAF2169137.1 hypothetical protein M409DRAFT_20364 [Zasmidium cellare ATCC 36951]
MQSEVPDPADPTQEQQHPSQSTLHQGPSSRPSRSPGAESSNAPGSSTGQRALKQPSRLRGSSRDTNEMQRSTTPPEASSADAIKYTRTGRVSKATKGHRVHHCEECGKTYTRAEHLRRHQQNHKPGAFPCDYPGCGRSFYREDLLVRHKARHNDPLNPPSRRHSVGSQSSAPDPRSIAAGSAQAPGVAIPPTSTTDPSLIAPELQPTTSDSDAQQSNVASRYPFSEVFPESTPFIQVFDDLSLTPKRVPIPPNELPASVPVTVDGSGFGPFTNPWDLSSPVSPPAYHTEYDYESADETAGLPYYQPHFSRIRHSSDTSFLGYGQPHSTSRSPVSAGSSTIYVSQWPYQSGCNASVGSISYLNGVGYMNHQSISAYPYNDTRALTAETQDFMELHDLALPGPGQQGASFDEVTSLPDEPRYINAYWESVHELYPLLHKPTFEDDSASPLLRAAMIALGGQVSGDRTDLSNARSLHEKCVKVLKKRTTQQTHTYRVCDMQAIVLIEVYSIFKSRRPPLQLSKNFENVYRLLANDISAMMPTPVDTPIEGGSFGDDLGADAASKQRLLLTCFTLEQQHSMLFGRLPTDCFAGTSQDLPFPSSQLQWDAVPGHEAGAPIEDTAYERISDALKAASYMTEPAIAPHDAFQSTLLMACMCQSLNGILEWTDGMTDPPMLLAAEQSPRCRLIFHTLMLCKNAQIRDLLAVAGESWVMAEKLSTQAEHTAAQIEIRDWASKSFAEDIPAFGFEVPVQRALSHAFSILAIHQQHPRTGVLFQEWAVYLAAVVIWARVYVSRVDGRHPRLSIPNATEPRPSPSELNQSAAALIQRAATPLMGWNESRTILLWAKMKIEKYDVPHTCGLTSGALDVLGKLVTRGNEDGWF